MVDAQNRGIVALIRSAITGESCDIPAGFDLKSAIETAKSHQVVNMLYYGAVNCGISQSFKEMQELFISSCTVMAVSEAQMYDINKVFKAFDENGIEYMPMKGVLLKSIYPKSDMRTMSDADILIKLEQYDKIKPLVAELGFTELKETDHELIWKKSKLHLELHKHMIATYNKDFYAYFGDGWRLAHPTKEQPNRYEMTPEDQYIYLFTHLAKHYRGAGIGIKHMTDLWVYRLANPNLNEKYIEKELRQLQLLEFYENVRLTLEVWFGNGKPTDKTDFITDVIIKSGAYGTFDAHIAAMTLRGSKTAGNVKKARTKELLNMFFLPLNHMRTKYKILNKFPFLLPVMWIVRGVKTVLFDLYKIKRMGKTMKLMSEENVDQYQLSLNYVGLDYNFGEKSE